MKQPRSILLLIFLIWVSLSFFTSNGVAQVLEQTFSENLADFEISTINPKWYFAPRSVSPGPVRATIRYKTPVNRFTPSVVVQVVALPNKKITLEKFVKKDIDSLPKHVEVINQTPIKHEGVKGLQLGFKDKENQIQFLQWVFLSKGKSFVVTCASKIPDYPHFEPDFKMILNSFRIK